MDVYPNPVKDELTINTGNSLTNLTVNIKDLQGRTVYTNSSNTSGNILVNTSNFSNGMYMIEATHGVTTIQRKIIKQ